jgi:hypothetical protein
MPVCGANFGSRRFSPSIPHHALVGVAAGDIGELAFDGGGGPAVQPFHLDGGGGEREAMCAPLGYPQVVHTPTR